ncbi:hypothetical protein AAFF_G00311560 [Aldrovandia affinis]|uniref:Uncharacterized protein n=1 Tax=Aldrovandia affinis TaxID=143900 RepID=A0AAD7WRJ0_9TELE|nr:hypothetical protein AAFF_G00311560 [Aldrovandia affinis]
MLTVHFNHCLASCGDNEQRHNGIISCLSRSHKQRGHRQTARLRRQGWMCYHVVVEKSCCVTRRRVHVYMHETRYSKLW